MYIYKYPHDNLLSSQLCLVEDRSILELKYWSQDILIQAPGVDMVRNNIATQQGEATSRGSA